MAFSLFCYKQSSWSVYEVETMDEEGEETSAAAILSEGIGVAARGDGDMTPMLETKYEEEWDSALPSQSFWYLSSSVQLATFDFLGLGSQIVMNESSQPFRTFIWL